MKYRLTISGVIEFKEGKDEDIRQLLLDEKSVPRQQLAIQELEEQARDIKIEMRRLPVEEVVTVCRRCQSKHHLTVVPDEEDDRFDDYICHNCDCHFSIDR